ncbi:MAG: molybdopterin adenylyltransferase [Spirochaetes bacterium]|nr:molybdopterin adenylyltransferase [Spirochaetota bacterium]
MKIKTAIITISDSAAAGKREDRSGPLIREVLEKALFTVCSSKIIPDDRKMIIRTLKQLADRDKVDLIITTGGTGLSRRDVTPEATLKVIEKEVPGITEYMRTVSIKKTDRGMLSRAVAGIRKQTLIINLPGSPKAVSEILEKIIDPVRHGINIMLGRETG